MNSKKNCSITGGPSAAFYTLGCRVNQYETRAIEEQFIKNGYTIKNFDEECDVYVINTCTVTSESDRKSRQIIRRAASVKKPTSLIIVCGCYSQGNPSAISEIDDVDIILGNSRKTEIVNLANEYLENKGKRILVTDIFEETEYEECSISHSDRTRAFVKIVDGCENNCTYCIIPKVRGRIRSRNEESILSEIKTLALNGYKEVVLTGIETAAYGKDFSRIKDFPLVNLIEKVSEIAGIERIRLGSMEPTVFTENFVERISKIKKLMPHYHLSMQSGSDAILRLMKRKYNKEQFFKTLERLRKYIPDVQITTDLIVGFPGESEDNFNETITFIKKCGFSFIHIFPYSKREGTPAAQMQKQLPNLIKKHRVAEVDRIMSIERDEILDAMLGKETTVLLETRSSEFIDGYTPNYIKVNIKNTPDNYDYKPGDIVNVIIIEKSTDTDGVSCLLGKII